MMIKNRPVTLLQVLNGSALLGMLVMNGLANSLPINGQTTGEVSDQIPSLFTPESYVFSIWGLIYLALLGFGIFQALPGKWVPAAQDKRFIEHIGYWFLLSCAGNAGWLLLWHYEYFLYTLVVMMGLLLTLIMIYRQLDIGRRHVTVWQKAFVHFPFSIYLGWISVATLANLSIVLELQDMALPSVAITTIFLVIAAGLGVFMTVHRNETAYPLVIAWALVGIAARHQVNQPFLAVSAAVLTCAVLVTLVFALIDRTPGAVIRMQRS